MDSSNVAFSKGLVTRSGMKALQEIYLMRLTERRDISIIRKKCDLPTKHFVSSSQEILGILPI
ncbi:hypothetical protein ASD82_06230 [Rhodanobacter sp. Root179]|nr:hypothetical protein ASD82_06230 [Rhodanobacter sp. Root179]